MSDAARRLPVGAAPRPLRRPRHGGHRRRQRHRSGHHPRAGQPRGDRGDHGTHRVQARGRGRRGGQRHRRGHLRLDHVRHPRPRPGRRGRGDRRRATRADRRAGQQRRWAVPLDARTHLAPRLRGGDPQQPHRHVPDDARGVQRLDGRARRGDGQHHRRAPQRVPRHGPHRGGAGRRGQPHDDGRRRVGACGCARQRGRPGPDRLLRAGHLRRADAVDDPHLPGHHPAAAPGQRGRGQRGGVLPALARGRVHHRARPCAIDGGTLGAHREWPLAPHDAVPYFDGFHRAELPTLFDEG